MAENSEVLFQDQLRDGLDLEDRWRLLSFGGVFTADQGIVETSRDGLRVRSPGTNKETGEPALEAAPPLGNHLKWVAQQSESSTGGFPGRDVPLDGALRFHLTLNAQVFGADQHDFGDAVKDPDSDFRLGAAVMNVMDFESGIVLDFWVTNTAIYPFYERIASADPEHANAQTFSSAFPPIARRVEDTHELEITHSGEDKVVTWHVDGVQVASVSRLGHPDLGAQVVLDHGGTPQDVAPRQLLGGFGIMTLMDATWPPSEVGLVDLGLHYEHPTRFYGGADVYGQGVELLASDFRVEFMH